MQILLVLQMHVADGGLPQYKASCHFPNSLCITLPLWSTTVPSTSFILEFQYFACNAHEQKAALLSQSNDIIHSSFLYSAYLIGPRKPKAYSKKLGPEGRVNLGQDNILSQKTFSHTPTWTIYRCQSNTMPLKKENIQALGHRKNMYK